MFHSAMVVQSCKAVLAGSLAGAAPLLFVTLIVAAPMLPDSVAHPATLLDWLVFAALPFLISLPIVLAGSIAIGIPATLVLKRIGRESPGAYTIVGGVAGFLIAVAAIWLSGSLTDTGLATVLLPVLGILGGMVTGRCWLPRARPTPPPDT